VGDAEKKTEGRRYTWQRGGRGTVNVIREPESGQYPKEDSGGNILFRAEKGAGSQRGVRELNIDKLREKKGDAPEAQKQEGVVQIGLKEKGTLQDCRGAT